MDSRKDDSRHGQPLLNEESERYSQDDDIELTELNSESSSAYRKPEIQQQSQGVSPILISVILGITVLGFTVNTEATAYFEDQLGWKKPFATLYITHGSLMLPWMCHIVYLRWKFRHIPFRQWLDDYLDELRQSIDTVDAYGSSGQGIIMKGDGRRPGALEFLWITMGYATIAVTVSGVSWFFSLALTTPADLTAIYNCSTFFAAVFSVPILKERLSWVSIAAVALSIVGTFVIAYGDTTAEHSDSAIGSSRFLGNLIACVGAVAFGLYEVLMKKWASPSTPEAAQSSLPLTLASTALSGFYTLATLWVGLIVLHFTGVEPFALPDLYTVVWIVIAVLAASFGITLLVLLVIWTDPVFGSMVNVLSVFFVALADWFVWGLSPSLATYAGGAMILVAFGMLSKGSLGGGKH